MKIKLSVEEHAKLSQDYPNAIITRLGEVEYNVEGVPQQILSQYKQGEAQAEQPVQLQARKLQQPYTEPAKQTDIASVMKILITSTIQPLLEDTKNDVKKEILDEINSQVATISSTVEELIKKTEKETIDLARQVDEISNKLATIKNLNEDEQSKILEKLAKMNQYLRDIPKI